MKLNFFDRSIIRTPSGSINLLDAVNGIKDIQTDGLQFIEQTFDSFFRNALYYASKDLYFQITKSLSDKTLPDKLFFSYLKYYLRFCSRSTPFGLFSTYGICNLKGTAKDLIRIEDLSIKLRIGLNFVFDLSAEILSNKNIWKYCFLLPNQTYYKIEDSIRYNEFYIENGNNHYRLSSIKNNEVLDSILNLASSGIYFNDLKIRVQELGYEAEEVEEYLYELIQNNIILLDIYPSPGTNDYLNQFLSKLSKIQSNEEIITVDKKSVTIKILIEGIESYRESISELELDANRSNADKLRSMLSENERSIDIVSLRNANFNLENRQLSQLSNVINLLSNLKVNTQKNSNKLILKQFIKSYKEKFGEAELPLLFVIDQELGIYSDRSKDIGVSLLNNAMFVYESNDTEYTFNKVDQLLLDKYQDAIQFNKYEISITKEECRSFENAESVTEKPAQTLNCELNLYKDAKNVVQMIFNGAYGSSAINNMGRFSFCSKDLLNLIEEIVGVESKGLAQQFEYMEIIDLPNLRHGNLVVRENCFTNELLINVPSVSSESKHKISLKDIVVFIQNDIIYLKDTTKNKLLIPRLSNSHNYKLGNLSHIYRFLSSLQSQWDSSIEFSWGFIETFAKFTPRVKMDNVIIQEATWHFSRSEVSELLSYADDDFEGFGNFCKRWNIPNQVYFVEADNKLFFDFEFDIYKRLFLTIISKKSAIKIKECIVNKGNSIVFDEAGRPFHSELILPFYESRMQNETKDIKLHEQVMPKMSPLSDCIYINVYSGEQQLDSFVKNELFALRNELFERKIVNNFFFIRYNEDGHHLRLRFFLKNATVYNDLFKLLNTFFKTYIENNIIQSFEIKNYHRELERYNYLGIKFTEFYFGLDSGLVIDLIKACDELKMPDRWLIGTYFIDKILDKFDFTLSDKKQFFLRLSNQFDREFNVDKYLRKSISKKYSENQHELKLTIAGENKRYHRMFQLIDQHFSRIVFGKPADENSIANRNGYVGSLIHMFFNRLLISQHRRQELFIYNFMYKFYDSLDKIPHLV